MNKSTQVFTRSSINKLRYEVVSLKKNFNEILTSYLEAKKVFEESEVSGSESEKKAARKNFLSLKNLHDISLVEISSREAVINKFEVDTKVVISKKSASSVQPVVEEIDPVTPGPSHSSPVSITSSPQSNFSSPVLGSNSSINPSNNQSTMVDESIDLGAMDDEDKRLARVFTHATKETLGRVFDRMTQVVSNQKKESIPFFSGKKNETTFRCWLKDVERKINSEGWSPDLSKNICIDKLSHVAKNFNESIPATLSFDEWKERFRIRFRDEAEVEVLKTRLSNLKQGEGMRVLDFAEQIDELFIQIYGPIPTAEVEAADADTDDEAAPIAVPEPLAVPHEEIRKSIFIKGLVEDIRNLLWQKLDPADSFDIMIKKGADIEKLIDRRKAIDGKDDGLGGKTKEFMNKLTEIEKQLSKLNVGEKRAANEELTVSFVTGNRSRDSSAGRQVRFEGERTGKEETEKGRGNKPIQFSRSFPPNNNNNNRGVYNNFSNQFNRNRPGFVARPPYGRAQFQSTFNNQQRRGDPKLGPPNRPSTPPNFPTNNNHPNYNNENKFDNNRSKGFCYFCGKPNHYIRECRSRLRAQSSTGNRFRYMRTPRPSQ